MLKPDQMSALHRLQVAGFSFSNAINLCALHYKSIRLLLCVKYESDVLWWLGSQWTLRRCVNKTETINTSRYKSYTLTNEVDCIFF